jgi:murein L,D-transpeptidase YcbB/YkuD
MFGELTDMRYKKDMNIGRMLRSITVCATVSAIAVGVAPARAADTFSVQVAISEHAQVLRDQLEAQSDVSRVAARFYKDRNFEPYWFGDDARLAALFDLIERAGEHALPLASYNVAALRDQVATAQSDDARVRVELLLTQTFVDYAQDLNSGVINPKDADPEIQFRPQVWSSDTIMQRASLAPSLSDFAQTLMPQSGVYARLVEEKKRLEAIVISDGWGAEVPANATLRPGRTSKSVTALRARLERMGYGPLGDSPVYDEQMVMMVKLVQSRFGLNTDGVAGPGTLGAVNVSARQRLQQVIVNLERERWLVRDRGTRHIMVNMADQMMAVIDDGEPTFTSRVVIGRNRNDLRTPEFSHQMTHLIVNPFWHVPRSIAEREYLPLLQQDPLALRKRGLWLLNRKGQRLNTEGADFNVYSEANFPFLIKQPPGGRNALGRVKFMFPNRNNIYLHDTPAKSLFVKDRRAYSHGCIRVQRPFDLAYHLMRPQFKNPEATFTSLLKKGTEKQVNLETPVPIYLSYNSAWVTGDGVAHYRADVYGRDKHVYRALERAGVKLQALEG